MDWLTNIKSFIDVVNYQSFTVAAEKRHSSPAVISRRVAWLEQQLNITLLHRTTRSLQLTEEGKQFYNKGKQWLAYLTEITLQLQNQQQVLQGPLHITLPVSFSETKLSSELIAEFAAQHPHIELTLDFSNHNYDLLEHEIDIAFRTSKYLGPEYASKQIATLKVGIYGSPKYFSIREFPQEPSDLVQHNCLVHQHIGYTDWEFQHGKKVQIAGNIKSNATHVLLKFAKQGLGLIRTLDCYVAEAIAEKSLQPILEEHWQTMDLYLVYKEKPVQSLRVQTFVDFMQRYDLKKYLIFTENN